MVDILNKGSSRYADNSRYAMIRYLPCDLEYAHHKSGKIAHDENKHYRVANSGSGELSCSAAHILMKDYLNIARNVGSKHIA